MGFTADPIATPGCLPVDTISDDVDARGDEGTQHQRQKGGRHFRGRPPLGPLRRTVREIGFTLITAGVVVLLFVAYQLWGTGLAERASQDKLKKNFTAQLATPPPAPAPSAPTVPPTEPAGDAIAHLVIPKIGVDKYVVDGVTTAQLRKGPGRYPQTAFPGQPGNAAVAGHRTTYGAPFYRLNELQPGDEVFVTTRAGQFHYTVAETRIVRPSDVSVLDPTPDNRLTLTTCNPRFSASNRLVVMSKLTGMPAPEEATPVAAPPARPTNLGSGDNGAWSAVLLYGALTIALWVAVRILGSRRRRPWLAIPLGALVCLVPLWFFFENAVRLLPPNV
jgi:sortase A